jgi:hypothetical protein
MIASDLLEQPCNKSDNAIKLVTSCNNIDEKLLNSDWLRAVQLFLKLHIV